MKISKFVAAALLLVVTSTLSARAEEKQAKKSSEAHKNVSRGLEGAPPAPTPSCDLPTKDPAIWDKSVTAGFNYTEGNSKTSSLNLNGKVMRDYLGEAWRFEADYNYGNAADDPNSQREVTKNNFRANGDYKHTLDSVWFAGANTSFAYDEIADLNYRVILSPALGAYVIKEDKQKLSLEAGPSYVFEDLGGEQNDFAAARIADRWTWKFSETASIYQSAEYLVSFEDSGNYIFNGEVGLEAALTSKVNLVLAVRDYYINQPAEDRRPNDVYTLTGLKVNL
jgi:putative salt-induced outer membrane protein YdiY